MLKLPSTSYLRPFCQGIFDTLSSMSMKAGDNLQSEPGAWEAQPPPPQKIDHDIRDYGGTTTAFDSMSLHLQAKKIRGSSQERVVELNQENGRLQHEATYYANLANGVLWNLLTSLQYRIRRMRSSISNCKMSIEGHRLAVEMNQQADDSHNKRELWFSRKTTQSYEAGGSVQARTNNTASPFPTLCPGYRTLPQPPGIHDSSVLGALVVRLTQENGKLRQSISLNRKLVFQVLVLLIPQIQHLILGLRSAIDEADIILRQANDAWGREIRFVQQTCTDIEPGHPSTDKASCPYTAKQRQGSTSLRTWIPQWPKPKYQDSAENQNAISPTELWRHRRILEFECSSYRKLIEEVLVQVVPAIESHSNGLQFIMENYAARDRKIRCPFPEGHNP